MWVKSSGMRQPNNNKIWQPMSIFLGIYCMEIDCDHFDQSFHHWPHHNCQNNNSGATRHNKNYFKLILCTSTSKPECMGCLISSLSTCLPTQTMRWSTFMPFGGTHPFGTNSITNDLGDWITLSWGCPLVEPILFSADQIKQPQIYI